MDQLQSFRTILVGWLQEIIPFNRLDTYVRKTREGIETSIHSTGRHANHVTYLLVTGRHSYSISATPTYLGCIASNTFYRPGENWTRGNDLPDGDFSRKTWEAIKDAIVRYELVKLDPLPQSVGIPLSSGPPTPEEEAYFSARQSAFAATERLAAAERALRGTSKSESEMPSIRFDSEEIASTSI